MNNANNQDPNNRFALLEIDDVPAAKPAPRAPYGADAPTTQGAPVTPRIPTTNTVTLLAAPAPAPGLATGHAESTNTSPSTGHDDAGRARAIASDAIAGRHGLVATEPTLFAWGTKGAWGDAAKRKRTELRERPLIADLSTSVIAQVTAEGRRADAAPLPGLTYGADERLRTRPGTAGAALSPQSLRQLLNRAGAPGYAAGYLGNAELPSALRVPHVNHWLQQATEPVLTAPATRGAAATFKDEPVKGVLLSKALPDAGRHIYGVVSPSYTRHDLDAVMRQIAGAVPNTARGMLKYDASTTKWSADITVGAEFEPIVGDIHRVTLRIAGHDAGGGSISVKLMAERVRCLNFSQIQLSSKIRGRIRHLGGNVAAQVRNLINVQGEALKDFADAWREANETALCEENPGDAGQVFRALIAGGYVDAPEGADTAVTRYVKAWEVEPGQTRAAYVNAITRAAHEATWSNPWAAETLEEQAGALLYNHAVISSAALEAVQS